MAKRKSIKPQVKLCDCMVERLSNKVDEMTGYGNEDTVANMLTGITDRELREELWLAIIGYRLEGIAAAFRLGMDAVTDPIPWIFHDPDC
jgi:hypothetical protein